MGKSRRLAAVVFTDIAGYTTLTHQNEPAALALLREQDRLLEPHLSVHNGRRVKSIGDGLLLEFPNALDALECMVRFQAAARSRLSGPTSSPLQVRVGIHLGDVEAKGRDILGDAVNIASRIESLAQPGEVWLSAQVFDQVCNKVPYPLVKIGPRQLKGLSEPVDLYRVLPEGTSIGTRAARTGVPRLAVLPLTNISPDAADEYFADGLTEELISVTSQIRSLRVVSSASVSRYKGTTASLRQIGSELGVDAVLQGSVRKQGNGLRITIRLGEVDSEENRWSQTFDRELGDVFSVQAEIAGQAARVLSLELKESEGRRLRKAPTSDLAAYELYLRATHAIHRRVAGLEEAIPLLEDAIVRDPGFALAHSSLANLLIGAAGETRPRGEAFSRARGLIGKALRLDPQSSDAHAARGNLLMQDTGDWKAAEASFRRAIQLNPSDSASHYWYSLLLWALQRYSESMDHARAALELDPYNAYAKLNVSALFESLGDGETALRYLHELVADLPEEIWPHAYLCSLTITLGRVKEARRELEQIGPPQILPRLSTRELLRARLGDPESGRQFLARWEAGKISGYVSPEDIALLYTAVGRGETALTLLEAKHQERNCHLWLIYQHPVFDSIRSDPRFMVLLRREGLPTTVGWRRPGGQSP